MSWRASFFRSWLVGTTLWVVGCLAVVWSADEQKFNVARLNDNDLYLVLFPPIFVLAFVVSVTWIFKRFGQ